MQVAILCSKGQKKLFLANARRINLKLAGIVTTYSATSINILGKQAMQPLVFLNSQ